MAKVDLSLTPQLEAELAKFRAERAFNPKAWIEDKCGKLNAYFARCGLSGCVTSVSGGVDSAVTIFLCQHAAKMANSPIKINVGVCQPIHSSDWALNRGKEVITKCGAREIVVDQTPIFDQLAPLVEKAVGVPKPGEEPSAFARGQLRSYMRTPVGYFVCQLLATAGTPAVVMGTGNKSEDGYLRYFCKAGDGVVDVQLISDLYKNEVFMVGAALGVPESVLKAPPSADLWAGQTDEEELGFSYDFVELYMGRKVEAKEEEFKAWFATLDEPSQKMFVNLGEKAKKVHDRNAHKVSIVNL
jgi:NAD+ synthase (glutamine-hydrolysing)